jgi:hypothetical protein
MATALVYLVALAVFTFLLIASRTGRNVSRAVDTVREVTTILRDSAVGDLDKERAAQRAALGLAQQGSLIVAKLLAVSICNALPVWGADQVGIATYKQILGFALRWDVLSVTTGGLVIIWLIARHGRQ